MQAVFVRTLKPGVTFEQFVRAWAPESWEQGYAVPVSVSRRVDDDRQVVTILDLDMSMEQFQSIAAGLVHPDAVSRLAQVVQSTQLEGIYEVVLDRPGR